MDSIVLEISSGSFLRLTGSSLAIRPLAVTSKIGSFA